MLAIHKISQTIEMLLAKADKYEDMASLMQGTDRETAMAFVDLAEAMLGQIGKLHTLAVKKIAEQKAKSDVEIPEYMKKMWEEKHVMMVNQKSMLEHKIKTIKGMM